MKTNFKAASAALAVTTILAGCASPSYGPQGQTYPTQSSYPAASQSYGTQYGVVDSIQVVEGQPGGKGGPGLGTVAGAVVGGLLGNQVGSGNGRTAATVAGAVAGGMVGNNVENRQRTAGPSMYQVGIRLDNGSYTTVIQDSAADLGVGSRVRIDGGRVYRY